MSSSAVRNVLLCDEKEENACCALTYGDIRQYMEMKGIHKRVRLLARVSIFQPADINEIEVDQETVENSGYAFTTRSTRNKAPQTRDRKCEPECNDSIPSHECYQVNSAAFSLPKSTFPNPPSAVKSESIRPSSTTTYLPAVAEKTYTQVKTPIDP